ncbi:hypothetical protein [Microbacterium sp. NPDC087589]|uniref:hypothetical protein n=1 Tax=Microbacterium sp. NPDC087589 TaxID=3364191 RepID=UPI0037F9A31B
MSITGKAIVETTLRADGISPLVYGVHITEGVIHMGDTLTAPSGERATVVAVQTHNREPVEYALAGARPVLVTSPVIALRELDEITVGGGVR